MSFVLYYSNFCENSGKLLQKIGNNKDLKDDIHFICIDKRIKKSDGIYIILPNQKELILPEMVTGVPALLLLNRGNQVLFGDNILSHLELINNKVKENTDYEAFSFGDINSCGVMSDTYSFLDQSVESLSAKGNGGLRQLRNNATLDYIDSVNTPIDDYVPNKVGDISIDKIQQERASVLTNN